MTGRTVLKRHIAAVVLALVCSVDVAGIAEELPPGGRASPPAVIDRFNLFPHVGALLIAVVPNDVGIPEGLVAFCSGALIHERVFLTAGHCTGPGSFAPVPPFIQWYSSVSAPMPSTSRLGGPSWIRSHTRPFHPVRHHSGVIPRPRTFSTRRTQESRTSDWRFSPSRCTAYARRGCHKRVRSNRYQRRGCP